MPLSPSETRETLAQLHHRPKRFLGQNFLVDGNIVRKSLELAALQPADAEVWAVEKDRTLHAHLAATLARDQPRLHLLQGDAMAQPLAGLPAARAEAGKVVANLPYAIATPWMDAVLGGPLPERLVLMLQQEAAQRYVMQPGSKQFGAISIFVQSAYEPATGHKVAPGCFFPKP